MNFHSGARVRTHQNKISDLTASTTRETLRVFERIRANLDKHNNPTLMHRWRFNLKTGETKEQNLGDRIVEHGMFNQRYAGRPYRYCYSAVGKKGMFLFTGLVKHDLERGTSTHVEFGPGRYGSESPFVPRIGAKDEDDGYLVATFDNSGTPSPKGRAWRKVIYGSVGVLASQQQAAARLARCCTIPAIGRVATATASSFAGPACDCRARVRNDPSWCGSIDSCAFQRCSIVAKSTATGSSNYSTRAATVGRRASACARPTCTAPRR